MRLTDSETALGNVVLVGLAVAAVATWAWAFLRP